MLYWKRYGEDGSSAWKVNGAPVPLERVKTEMKNLGVQLDNLCQFLPQDRVVGAAVASRLPALFLHYQPVQQVESSCDP